MSGKTWEEAQLDMYQERERWLGANLFGADAWHVLLAISEGRGSSGVTLRHIGSRVNSSAAALARWLKVLEVNGLVVPSASARGEEQFRLTSKARRGLASLHALRQHAGSTNWEKIQVPVSKGSLN